MTTPFNIALSEPHSIQTPRGPRWYRTGVPTEDFWFAWRTGKESLRAAGYQVRKENNVFIVDIPHDPPDEPNFPTPGPIQALRNAKGLLAYQVPHAQTVIAALTKYGSALDASDPGTGKTYVAIATGRETRLALCIVCPKSVIGSWRRVAESFGIEPYFIMNWEGCKSKKFLHGTLDSKTEEYYWKLGKTKCLLVFDEAHKAKAEYSQNAKMVIAAKRQGVPTLLLSGTIASSPRDMRAMGYMLGMHSLSDFRGWSMNLGCYQIEHNGQARGWGCSDPVAAMAQVHRHLFPAKGSRIRIADLGDAFPDTQITADIYPVEKTKQQNEAYADLLEKIRVLKREKKEGWKAASMVLNLRYRQLAEALKVDLIVALAKDYLESGLSVVIFVNFTETLHRIESHFEHISLVHGQQTTFQRQENIDLFQDDVNPVIVANIQAGGVGVSLHDVRGVRPRVALVCPTYSARDLKQALGRVHRAGGKSKSLQRVIYAAGTVEEQVCQTVAKRLEAISSLNDGHLMEKDLLGVLGTEEDREP